MTTDVKAPQFPESVPEGTIASWHKNVGDAVTEGEVLLEIETDKVMMEVPAIASGTLAEISKKAGDTVKSQEVVGKINEGAAAAPAAKPAAESAPAAKPAPTATTSAPAAKETKSNDAVGPAARRALQENDIKATDVKGTGVGGRITTQDVAETADKKPAKSMNMSEFTGGRPEKRVPMTRLRATIAKRLVEVGQTTAMLTTFNEVDMKPIMDLRAKYKDLFEKKQGVKLGFMGFFVKAATEALKRFPSVNASIDGNDIVYHGFYDVGVAVSTERGLVVPVVRNTDLLNLAEIEIAIRDYAAKARDNKIELSDMQGGTFTITNGGVFGSMLSTPIINAPQSAILGMHNIVERPVVVNGQIVIRPIMYLALSYDHRIVDGRESVSFLKTIKELLEDPSRILLDI
jgi:2-oxoglutarate dehydrogenase E2 component (dihydrolipoamide succinyltransferase)